MISIIVIEIANVSNVSQTIMIVVFQLIILVSHVRELWIVPNIGNEWFVGVMFGIIHHIQVFAITLLCVSNCWRWVVIIIVVGVIISPKMHEPQITSVNYHWCIRERCVIQEVHGTENGQWLIMGLGNLFLLSPGTLMKLRTYRWNHTVEHWGHYRCLTSTLNEQGYVIWNVILGATNWWNQEKNLNLWIGPVRGLISFVVSNKFNGKFWSVIFVSHLIYFFQFYFWRLSAGWFGNYFFNDYGTIPERINLMTVKVCRECLL